MNPATCEYDSFTSRSGTEVRNAISRMGADELHDGCGGRILDHPRDDTKRRNRVGACRKSQSPEGSGGSCDSDDLESLNARVLTHTDRRKEERGDPVPCFNHRPGSKGTQRLHPAGHEPLRVGPPGGEMPDRIFIRIRKPLDPPAFPPQPPEDGVDDAGPLPSSDPPCLVHRLIHRCMSRDRPHVQELVCAESEQVQEVRRKGTCSLVQVEPEKMIESPPEPDRTENKFVHPPTIAGIERWRGRFPGEIQPGP